MTDEALTTEQLLEWANGLVNAKTYSKQPYFVKEVRAVAQAYLALIASAQGKDGGLAENCADLLGNPFDPCEDCPPVGYPTDETRCSLCPRKTPSPSKTERTPQCSLCFGTGFLPKLMIFPEPESIRCPHCCPLMKKDG